jgi:hypothetical protein
VKFFELGTLVIIIAIAALAAIGIVSQKYFGEDNVVEETVEAIIKEKTGLDIDLSPKTIEEKKDSSISN